jgi:GTP cyclohydrolase I
MNQAKVEEYFGKLMTEGLGLDLSDPNLKDTPHRVAKMYCEEFFKSLNINYPLITTFPNEQNYDEIILLDNIPFVSMCSHHFLPFSGKAWFAYIPDKKLVGASKINRLIAYYSAKPQLQENLSKEIVDCFVRLLEPKAVMLVMRAIHGCMACRGVKQGNDAGMMTSVVYGIFKEDSKSRAEVLNLIALSNK